MNRIKDIYADYREGNAITTPELDRLEGHMRQMSEMLFECGDVFKLSAVEALSVADQCSRYLRARMEPEQ